MIVEQTIQLEDLVNDCGTALVNDRGTNRFENEERTSSFNV